MNPIRFSGQYALSSCNQLFGSGCWEAMRAKVVAGGHTIHYVGHGDKNFIRVPDECDPIVEGALTKAGLSYVRSDLTPEEEQALQAKQLNYQS